MTVKNLDSPNYDKASDIKRLRTESPGSICMYGSTHIGHLDDDHDITPLNCFS